MTPPLTRRSFISSINPMIYLTPMKITWQSVPSVYIFCATEWLVLGQMASCTLIEYCWGCSVLANLSPLPRNSLNISWRSIHKSIRKTYCSLRCSISTILRPWLSCCSCYQKIEAWISWRTCRSISSRKIPPPFWKQPTFQRKTTPPCSLWRISSNNRPRPNAKLRIWLYATPSAGFWSSRHPSWPVPTTPWTAYPSWPNTHSCF